jgi:protein-S-isoprenylcysteine O-methyltransferase Ste14
MFTASRQLDSATGGRCAFALDQVERVVLVALYAWLAIRLFQNHSTAGIASAVIVLLSEGLVVLFVLTRRAAREMSQRPFEWCLAAAATILPLGVQSGGDWNFIPPLLGGLIAVLGIVIQFSAKLSLGRSFGCVPALRGLKTSGPYRYVRHPIYAGYLLTHVGFLAMNPSGWNLAIYVGCYAAQIPRLLAEERMLSRDAHYADYQATVRYRLIPGLY